MKTWRIIGVAAWLAAAGSSSALALDAVPAAGEKAAPAKQTWKKGDKVDIEWHGSWWKGVILEVEKADNYKVHFVGFSDGYDEVVAGSRIRARTANAKHGGLEDTVD